MSPDPSDPCPHCGAELEGDPIPSDDLALSEKPRRYSRKIGVEISGEYDGVLFWRCPDCGKAWHRWPEGTWQRDAAQKYVDALI